MFSNLFIQIRSNPRLRWGIWCVLVILWLYAVLLARDEFLVYQEKYSSASATVTRLNAQLAQNDWVSRVGPAKSLAMGLESRLWQAPSAGLAQANFEEWLKTTLTQNGINPPNFDMAVVDREDSSAGAGNVPGQEVLPPSDLWEIRAKFFFEFKPEGFAALMSAIEFNEKLVVVDKLLIRKEPVPRVEVQLTGFFQKQAESKLGGNGIVEVQPSPAPPQ